jgi:calmodulin
LYQTPTEKDLKDWEKEVDPENTGRVDFPEFLSLMAKKYKEPDTEDELIEAMTSIFNPDGPTISLREFRNTMTNLGEKLTEE